MKRYKSALIGTLELEEIGGVKPLIRPTLDDKASALELFINMQTAKKVDLKAIVAHLTKVLQSASPDESPEDIQSYLEDNVLLLWYEYMLSMKIIQKNERVLNIQNR